MDLDLSSAEKALLNAVANGTVADLGGERIRAQVVRGIAFSRIGDKPVPSFGLRIRNASIEGQLNFDSCLFNFPFVLISVEIIGQNQAIGLCLRDSYIKRVSLEDVKITGALAANRATFENGFMAERVMVSGPAILADARSGHAFSITASSIGDGTSALAATGLQAKGSLTLRKSKFSGVVGLPQIQLAGGLYAENSTIKLNENRNGIDTGTQLALDLESASIAGDLLLENIIAGASIKMENARIGGRIEARKSQVMANGGSWNMEGINVVHGLSIAHAQIKGVLKLSGADIGKLLSANYVSIDGGETAIQADLIRVDGNFEMTSARLLGQLRCPGARIRGQMRLSEAKIHGSDMAIRGDGSNIAGGCLMSRSFMVGLIRFPASKIGNQFRLSGATLKVENGPALLMSGTSFARDVELNTGFETIGAIVLDQAEIVGACDLTGSRLRSVAVAHPAVSPAETTGRPRQLDEEANQTVLSLVDAQIGRLQMPALSDERPRGIINLSRAHVGAYEDWASTWPPTFKRRTTDVSGRDIDHLILDGLVYDHLVNPAGIDSERDTRAQEHVGRRRMHWLDGQKRSDTQQHFRPQPWVQLAKRLTAQGLASDARHISIQHRRRERRARALSSMKRWESRLLDWLALYGFNPWRTVMWSIAVFILCAGTWSWAANQCSVPGCFDQQIFIMSNTDAYHADTLETVYPPFSGPGYALDTLLPFLNLGYADHWRPNVNHGPITTLTTPNIPTFLSGETDKDLIFTNLSITIGGMLYMLFFVQQIIGIILLSLIATGFAGVLRNDS